MLTEDKETIKIIDFGFALKLNSDNKCDGSGTRMYMSPEQLNDKVNLSTDIWAFGCIMLEMFTDIIPYKS